MVYLAYLRLVEALESILLAISVFLVGLEECRICELEIGENTAVVVNFPLLRRHYYDQCDERADCKRSAGNVDMQPIQLAPKGTGHTAGRHEDTKGCNETESKPPVGRRTDERQNFCLESGEEGRLLESIASASTDRAMREELTTSLGCTPHMRQPPVVKVEFKKTRAQRDALSGGHMVRR